MSETKSIIYHTAYRRLGEFFTEPQSKFLAKCIVAQSQHETANYTSNAFLKNNNIGGYKVYAGSIYQKNPPPAGVSQIYGYYETVEQSTLEIADWLKRRKPDFENVKTIGEYALALKKNKYYEDTVTNYTNGLGMYFNALVADGFNSIENIINGSGSKEDAKPLGILAVIAIVVFYLLRKVF